MDKMSLFTSGISEVIRDENGNFKYSIGLECGDVEENGEFRINIHGVKGYDSAMEALDEAKRFIEQEKID